MADTTYTSTAGDTVRDMKNQVREFASDMTEEVSDAASRVKDQASAYGRKAADLPAVTRPWATVTIENEGEKGRSPFVTGCTTARSPS